MWITTRYFFFFISPARGQVAVVMILIGAILDSAKSASYHDFGLEVVVKVFENRLNSLATTERLMIAQLWSRGSMKIFDNSAKLPHIAKDCLLTDQEQACTRITWLFGRLFVVTMPKMAKYTGKWLLTAPYIPLSWSCLVWKRVSLWM